MKLSQTKKTRAVLRGFAAALLALCTIRATAADDPELRRIASLSFEELLEVRITSVAKRETSLWEAPAAAFVVTQDDLKRSGVTSVAEALRMVPGLQVARINAKSWGISARGFNEEFSGKLLVLLDGRTIYHPIFSGVAWDAFADVVLEDVAHIEVIRGPGATLWGANAVNGVINITTKNARDTQGGLVVAGAGNEEYGGAIRYGGQLATNVHYRVYTKYSATDDMPSRTALPLRDAWHLQKNGVRVDWDLSDVSHLTLQGDFYAGETDGTEVRTLLVPPYSRSKRIDAEFSGANSVARWNHQFSDVNTVQVQAFYDLTRRADGMIGERLQTFDIEGQHELAVGERFEIH